MLFGEREVVWSEIFDSSRRHCWEQNDGTRVLDNSAPEYDEDGGFNQPCTRKHIGDYGLVGKVAWMRFIHAFDGDSFLTLVKLEGNREVYEDFTVTRFPEKNVAVIDCYNPDLVEKCWEAMDEVTRQYAEFVESQK